MKFKVLALLVLAAGVLQGCYTVQLSAPELRNVASFSPLRGQNKGAYDMDYRQW